MKFTRNEAFVLRMKVNTDAYTPQNNLKLEGGV